MPGTLVLDAGALAADVRAPSGRPFVLTPHAGEMAGLVDEDKAQVEADPARFASAWARRSRSVVVLKGVDTWIADPGVEVVITTGGTGVTGRDVTPEALAEVAEKHIAGFGELFRMLSYQKIGTSSLQSRADAAVAGGTYLFCLPGSPGACRDGWDEILRFQLDIRHRPCNFAELIPRLREHEA